MVEFDRNSHVYSVNGNRLPSVTQVLPEVPQELLFNQRFIEKTNIGTRVHFACEVLDNDIIGWKPLKKKFKLHKADIDSISKAMKCQKDFFFPELEQEDIPYIKAWVEFRNNMNPEIIAVEERVHSDKYGYAGTVDRVLLMKKTLFVSDIKTSTEISPAASLQTAGYVVAMNEKRVNKITKRSIVHLLPSGMFKWKEYSEKSLQHDVNVFLSKLVSFKWDLENVKRR